MLPLENYYYFYFAKENIVTSQVQTPNLARNKRCNVSTSVWEQKPQRQEALQSHAHLVPGRGEAALDLRARD